MNRAIRQIITHFNLPTFTNSQAWLQLVAYIAFVSHSLPWIRMVTVLPEDLLLLRKMGRCQRRMRSLFVRSWLNCGTIRTGIMSGLLKSILPRLFLPRVFDPRSAHPFSGSPQTKLTLQDLQNQTRVQRLGGPQRLGTSSKSKSLQTPAWPWCRMLCKNLWAYLRCYSG